MQATHATARDFDWLPILLERWNRASTKVSELAESIPAEAFDVRPSGNIRTPAEVVRHLAFWNQYLAQTLKGAKPDAKGDELPAAQYPTKPGMLAVFTHSVKEVVDALTSCPHKIDRDTVAQMLSFVVHTSEHYGQLTVYARLQGIVPPVSRG